MTIRKENKAAALFIIFNRPKTTKAVFEQIAKYKPEKLFIAADGARTAKEKLKCRKAREITEKITWKCDVKRLYRDKNLGCKKSVSSAIDWFFENVSEGIILEDDCFPNDSFFKFCEVMLARYRNNKKISTISGTNYQSESDKSEKSYFFSKYPHIWGWATWRRAWKNYDVEMSSWPEVKRKHVFDKYYDSFIEKTYWNVIFDAAYAGKINAWSYQWLFACWKSGSLSVNPGVNLVRNLGFGPDATHTKKDPYLSNLKNEDLVFPLRSVNIIRDVEKDKYKSPKIFTGSIIDVLYIKFKYRW